MGTIIETTKWFLPSFPKVNAQVFVSSMLRHPPRNIPSMVLDLRALLVIEFALTATGLERVCTLKDLVDRNLESVCLEPEYIHGGWGGMRLEADISTHIALHTQSPDSFVQYYLRRFF